MASEKRVAVLVVGAVIITLGMYYAGDTIITSNGLNSLWHLLPIGMALCGLGFSLKLAWALGGKG